MGLNPKPTPTAPAHLPERQDWSGSAISAEQAWVAVRFVRIEAGTATALVGPLGMVRGQWVRLVNSVEAEIQSAEMVDVCEVVVDLVGVGWPLK